MDVYINRPRNNITVQLSCSAQVAVDLRDRSRIQPVSSLLVSMASPVPMLEQIQLKGGPRGTHGYQSVAGFTAEQETYEQEHHEHQARLLALCPASAWPSISARASGSPRPILINKEHERQLKTLQEALTTVITDIVDRWWTDDVANLPKRMPLEKGEEELLKVRD